MLGGWEQYKRLLVQVSSRLFYYERIFNLVKSVLHIYWGNHVMPVFQFLYVTYNIYWFAYVELSLELILPHNWDKSILSKPEVFQNSRYFSIYVSCRSDFFFQMWTFQMSLVSLLETLFTFGSHSTSTWIFKENSTVNNSGIWRKGCWEIISSQIWSSHKWV